MKDIDKLLNDMEKISKELDECLQRTQSLLVIVRGIKKDVV